MQLKVVELTGFLSPKSFNLLLFTLILYDVGGPGSVVSLTSLNLLPVLSPFIEKSMA